MAVVKIPTHTMTTGDVARVLGVSDTSVYNLEDELQPIRNDSGQRRYSPNVVARVARRRAAVMGTK